MNHKNKDIHIVTITRYAKSVMVFLIVSKA